MDWNLTMSTFNGQSSQDSRDKFIYWSLFSVCGLVLVFSGIYMAYISKNAAVIAFNNDYGEHFISLTRSFYSGGITLFILGLISFVTPLKLRYIVFLVSSIFIAYLLFQANTYKTRFGYEIRNTRVFSQAFMNVTPPSVGHDGHYVKDESDQELDKLEKQLDIFMTDFNAELKEKGVEEMLLKKYYDPKN